MNRRSLLHRRPLLQLRAHLPLRRLFTVRSLAAAAALLCAAPIFAAAPAIKGEPVRKVTGDYVEARTASVFAGACHYNGELVTAGRDAVMAWSITSGAWNGTDLAGVRAMAAVSCDANLADDHAARRSEVVVDAATDAQAAAFIDLLKTTSASSMGEIVSARRAAVTFRHDGRAYAVEARGFAACSVRAMPNDECCKMPNLVWYTPLASLAGRKVGFTESAVYTAGTLGDPWERSGENSAFYGPLAF